MFRKLAGRTTLERKHFVGTVGSTDEHYDAAFCPAPRTADEWRRCHALDRTAFEPGGGRYYRTVIDNEKMYPRAVIAESNIADTAVDVLHRL